MLIEYLPIAVLFIISAVLAVLVILIGGSFGPKIPSSRKGAPYESGMIPTGPGTRKVPVRYYMVAVLFILFDIEVVFFLPFAVVFEQLGWFAIVEIFVFIVILLVGYVYAWKKGALEWE